MSSTGGLQVLIVEGDRGLRERMGAILAADGWDVSLAADAREATELAYMHSPDVVVLGMDEQPIYRMQVAVESLRCVCDTPFRLLATGTRRRGDALAALGATDFLPQPIEFAAVRAMVRGGTPS
ncbi:MAG TPA: hypothetical protein VFS62_05810 [Chloroflexota bacterium]|jgi:two-component system OmpR family response regulator|nr:hypothetical protein [Chloroflexota bacterium]